MQEMERIAIERECERISIAYARHVDFRDYDAFVDLFSEDCRLDVGGLVEGRAALQGWLARRPENLRSRHVFTNISIDVIDADHARGVTYVTLYRHVGDEALAPRAIELVGPAAVGHYEDEFVRTVDGWRFASRTAYLAFIRADAFPKT